jgi:hypothetical protein
MEKEGSRLGSIHPWTDEAAPSVAGGAAGGWMPPARKSWL